MKSTIKRSHYVIRGIFALTAIAGLVPMANTIRAQAPSDAMPPAADPPAVSRREPTPIDEATVFSNTGRWNEAKALLAAMDPSKMKPNEANRWRLVSSRVAIRLGDRAWLKQLNTDGSLLDSANEAQLLDAYRFLLAGDTAGTLRQLALVKKTQALSEIPRRRFLELHSKVEQLDGHPLVERVYLAKLVDFAGHWSEPRCQQCHANPAQFGDDVTTLNVSDWWVGKRFADVLSITGGAARVRAEAERELRNNPTNDSARLRLAYALRAQGQDAAVEKHLRAIPWAEFPDRPIKKPLRFATFP